MKVRTFLITLMAMTAIGAASAFATKPNIVLIMADDIGWEGLSCYGSLSYETPNLDKMAADGLRFTHCYSQPKCTPSRVQIMTGKYNFRNYKEFGLLDSREKTFGHLMQEAGYKTCIAGKWQLNGSKAVGGADSSRPLKFGFDKSCLWQVTTRPKRYRDPGLEIDGNPPTDFPGSYGPDIVNDYVCRFIQQNKSKPFFVYYPMILPHDPFVPTPVSREWDKLPHKSSPRHFKDMVHYIDRLVGRVVETVQRAGLSENTLILFTGDNGTAGKITTQTKTGPVRGAKGSPRDPGIHVPMLALWPGTTPRGKVCDDLVDFSDFLPTLVEASNRPLPDDFLTDGRSFLPQLRGQKGDPRSYVFFHYYPRHGTVWKSRSRMVRTKQYKLYHDGRFYDMKADPVEKKRIRPGKMNPHQKEVFAALKRIIKHYDDEGAAEDAKIAREQWELRVIKEGKSTAG